MDDIATAGKAEHIRNGINNHARMETEREEEEINETAKAGRIQRAGK